MLGSVNYRSLVNSIIKLPHKDYPERKFYLLEVIRVSA